MTIVLHARASPGFRVGVERAFGPGQVTVVDEAEDPGEALREAEVLLHVLTPVTPAIIAGAPRLQLIQKLGVGVNTIALDAAAAHGVAVCNMPGTNTPAVAEAALALMLAVLRQTCRLDAATRAGRGWLIELEAHDRSGEIAGRTVGLVGFGHSASRLARVLGALGATVVYTARHVRPEAPYRFLTLPELLAVSEIVSLHVPLTAETTSLVDPFAMKPGALLINVARGGLVDEARLVEALRSGHLSGAGLDVFATEPVAVDHPLLALPNVVVSPHVAWLTPETLDRSLCVAAENVRRLQAGEPLLHRVQ